MRHHDNKRTLGRDKDGRTALMKGLARSLVLHEKIKTTEAKAKELRPMIEKMVTKAKADTVATRRLLTSRIGSPVAVKKMFDTLAPKYEKRAGGYTRITKLPQRKGDAARMAMIEFV